MPRSSTVVVRVVGLVLAILAGPAAPADATDRSAPGGPPTPALADRPDRRYSLVWEEEFDRLDPARWRVAPDQWRTRFGTLDAWAPDLADVRDGRLRLRVEKRGGRWEGALVHGRGLASWTFGYVEARAKLPAGRGLWSAIWMMPEENAYGYWPRSGEIDIVEYLGRDETRDEGYASVHFRAEDGGGGKRSFVAGGRRWWEGWHRWGVLWDRDAGGRVFLRFYVDGVPYGEVTQDEWPAAPGGGPGSPFDRPFFLIANITVGGDWAGPPDDAVAGSVAEIDWIRVWAAERGD